MTKNYVERRKELRAGFRALADGAGGEAMSGFGALHRGAMADGELSKATKELIALAIGVTSHCDGCIAFHVHDALRAGASRAQIEEALGVAVSMGGGPAAIYAADALDALTQFEAELQPEPPGHQGVTGDRAR